MLHRLKKEHEKRRKIAKRRRKNIAAGMLGVLAVLGVGVIVGFLIEKEIEDYTMVEHELEY